MLKGIPECISPDLLKTLAEMGHGDTIVIGDAYYPHASNAKNAGAKLIRLDGVRATDIIDGILRLMPLDVDYTEHPFIIMERAKEVKDSIPTPSVWQEYKDIVKKHEAKGEDCIGYLERLDFYKAANNAYAVVATGETNIYACVILKKGVR